MILEGVKVGLTVLAVVTFQACNLWCGAIGVGRTETSTPESVPSCHHAEDSDAPQHSDAPQRTGEEDHPSPCEGGSCLREPVFKACSLQLQLDAVQLPPSVVVVVAANLRWPASSPVGPQPSGVHRIPPLVLRI